MPSRASKIWVRYRPDRMEGSMPGGSVLSWQDEVSYDLSQMYAMRARSYKSISKKYDANIPTLVRGVFITLDHDLLRKAISTSLKVI